MVQTIHRSRDSAPGSISNSTARFEPVSARRGAKLPEVVLGVVLVAAFGLGSVLWQASSSRKQPVLVLTKAVHRGSVVTREDLRVADVRLGSGISNVASLDASSVVGKTAAADLKVGTLLSRDLVTAAAMPTATERVVGVALLPGEIPTSKLRAGDRVDVIRTASPSAPNSAVTVLAAGALVGDIEKRTDSTGAWIVSLIVPESGAADVAGAASLKQVRLTLVGGN